jgi:flagellar hook-associated protein 3 FlgL
MRITSTRIIEQQATAADNAQTALGQISNEASSGMRVTSPSQDPTAWLAAHRATLRDALSKGVDTAMQYGQQQLQQTDGALSSIESIITQVRQTAVEGSNATYSASDRAGLAAQVQGLLSSAVAAANTQTANGEYVLAGSKSTTAPFDAAGNYSGDAATRAILTTASSTYAGTVPGSDLTAANGVDVLPLLQKVATALANNDVPTLQSTLDDLQAAGQQVGSLRERVGTEMTALSTAATASQTLQTNLETSASNYVEADAVTVASQLAQASTALTTTQTVAAHVIQVLSQGAQG